MSLLLTFLVSLFGIICGKYLFRHWVNHLTLYSVIWGFLIILYELKLLPYYDIIPLTWFFIISSFLSFLFGILTLISLRNLSPTNSYNIKPTKLNFKIFSDDGKSLKYSILISSIIGILAAVQHWLVLIDIFGNVTSALINANLVYKLNLKGGGDGVIPYISNFGFVAVFFSGIYSAYKGKFSFLTLLPFIGIIIKSLATFGRVSMLFALMEFLITFFLFKYLLETDSEQRFKFSKRNAVIYISILIFIVIISASLARATRISSEYYKGTSKELKDLEGNFIITPSIYFYLSCDIGVLNQYMKSDGEKTKFGENTFMLFHYILSKFNIIERPSDLQKGYNFPMGANTGTFIRELHADFTVVGVYLVPFILGFVITWLWFKFYINHGLIVLTFLTYLSLIIGFSFLMMITRLDIWGISLIFILILIPIIEKFALILSRKSIKFN
ncbi:MAG: oligosaccharide repeat unit polymerase [Ignavibacteriae bacterium]|nr:oligosaccharide repeat unit polymerase [Ignavibacteriota bacterium]